MDHKWKQLILGVNFLVGFRVNEIPNETFLLDSHQPFICSSTFVAHIVQKTVVFYPWHCFPTFVAHIVEK
jgi:hypothetical protein